MKTTNRQKPMGADITPAGLAKTAGHADANTPENLGMHTPPAAGKAAHTPTPWFPIPQNPRGTYWRITQEPTAAPYNCDVAQGITKEDATFIVTACNSHAALVEALEKSQLAFMNVARLARFESKASMEAVAQLRHCEERNVAALALAKGGAQ